MSDEHNTRDDAKRIGDVNKAAAEILDPVAHNLPAAIWDRLHDSIAADINARDTALRDARAEIERLKYDIHRTLDAASGEAAEVNRLRVYTAAKDEVVAAAREVSRVYFADLGYIEYRSRLLNLREALDRLDATPSEEGEG